MRNATLAEIVREVLARADPQTATILQRFFKTAPGQYGEGETTVRCASS